MRLVMEGAKGEEGEGEEGGWRVRRDRDGYGLEVHIWEGEGLASNSTVRLHFIPPVSVRITSRDLQTLDLSLTKLFQQS